MIGVECNNEVILTALNVFQVIVLAVIGLRQERGPRRPSTRRARTRQ